MASYSKTASSFRVVDMRFWTFGSATFKDSFWSTVLPGNITNFRTTLEPIEI